MFSRARYRFRQTRLERDRPRRAHTVDRNGGRKDAPAAFSAREAERRPDQQLEKREVLHRARIDGTAAISMGGEMPSTLRRSASRSQSPQNAISIKALRLEMACCSLV